MAAPARRTVLDELIDRDRWVPHPGSLAPVGQWLGPCRAVWSRRFDTLERHLQEKP